MNKESLSLSFDYAFLYCINTHNIKGISCITKHTKAGGLMFYESPVCHILWSPKRYQIDTEAMCFSLFSNSLTHNQSLLQNLVIFVILQNIEMYRRIILTWL